MDRNHLRRNLVLLGTLALVVLAACVNSAVAQETRPEPTLLLRADAPPCTVHRVEVEPFGAPTEETGLGIDVLASVGAGYEAEAMALQAGIAPSGTILFGRSLWVVGPRLDLTFLFRPAAMLRGESLDPVRVASVGAGVGYERRLEHGATALRVDVRPAVVVFPVVATSVEVAFGLDF